MASQVKPSDVVKSAADELGQCLAIARTKALNSVGKERDDLFNAYDVLLRKLQRLMRANVRAIDSDKRINDCVDQLAMFSQQLAKVKREMTTAKTVIDRVTKVATVVDQVLNIVT